MRQRIATENPLSDPEVVLNLWAYADEDGTILRLAGKTYVMQGSDEEKLAMLRPLATSDFLSVSWSKVPSNFNIQNIDNNEMSGVAHASMLTDRSYHDFLFGPLIEVLAQSVPEQLRSINGDYQKFRLEIPDEPLCISTIVLEKEDGNLVPLIAG
jgi:hypothetical protein